MPVTKKDFVTIAASETNFGLGDDSATDAGGKARRGDELDRVIITPVTTAPGIVSIRDGLTGTVIILYTGGTVGADLTPITLELQMRAFAEEADPGWFMTTGANVTVVAIGRFQRKA